LTNGEKRSRLEEFKGFLSFLFSPEVFDVIDDFQAQADAERAAKQSEAERADAITPGCTHAPKTSASSA
jgi:hypothetical protein